MPSIIRMTDTISITQIETVYAPPIIGSVTKPPTPKNPTKTVYVNGVPIVNIGDMYLTHVTIGDTHKEPAVLTNGNKVYSDGLEIAVVGSRLLGCAVTLLPPNKSNVYINGPNPA